MDEAHEALRQRLALRSDGGDQFLNGVRGFGLGIYGGFTSIVHQTYAGVKQDGAPVSASDVRRREAGRSVGECIRRTQA
jgi:hypothetical protein